MNTSFFKPNGPLLWSSTSIILMVLVLSYTLPSLLVAMFGFGPGNPEIATMLSSLMSEHEEMMTTYQARINGRSVFFTPPPTPKPRPKQIQRPADPRPEIAAAKPTSTEERISDTYTGPSIMGIFGEEVWFVGSGFQKEILRISVGEEKDGLKILAADPPWSVTVQYNRGEYEVSLFEIIDLGFDKPAAAVPPPPGATVRMTNPDDDRGDQTKPTSDKTQISNDTSGDSVSKSHSPDAEKSDAKDKTGNESPSRREKENRQPPAPPAPPESPESPESLETPETSAD